MSSQGSSKKWRCQINILKKAFPLNKKKIDTFDHESHSLFKVCFKEKIKCN